MSLIFSLDPLRKYTGETITLELPGAMTIFEIDWISIYDLETNANFGSIIITDELNVPPSLIKIQSHKASLPNCRQLHKDFRVSWEVFGPQITFELSGQVMEDEYMSFGISGSESSSQMLGADVAVAYIDGVRGYAIDYNITSLAPVCYTSDSFSSTVTNWITFFSACKCWARTKESAAMIWWAALTVIRFTRTHERTASTR